MDGSVKQRRRKNPRENANIFSIVTFIYTIPTFWLGYRKELEESDIYETASNDKCQKWADIVEKMWLEELERRERSDKKPSLWKVFMKIFGVHYVIIGLVLCFVEIVVKPFQVLSLGGIISYFLETDLNRNRKDLYIEASKLCLSSLLIILINTAANTHGYLWGIQLRSICSFLIYRKSLKLSKAAVGKTTSGQMMNLISNDIKNFERWVVITHYAWIAPIQALVLAYFIYQEVGVATIIGVTFILLFIPLHYFLGKILHTYRGKSAARTDDRIRLMNEIISGISIIKMYTWEKPFAELVSIYRRLEMKAIKVAVYMKGINSSLTVLNTRVAIFVTLMVYVLLNNNLNARKVFLISALYNLLRLTMVAFFPEAVGYLAEMNVCFRRLANFLLLDETPHATSLIVSQEESAITLEKASAKWSETLVVNTLSNVNLNIKRKSLIGVIGSVGSGKTSLLHAILNELPLKEGTVNVQGALSYASQEPWLFSESIKQNILFGAKLDTQRYKDVIKACALETDFTLLPYADRTLIGERGASLSGGQRARVNLARAVYRNADIYLLDDPLSAVDTQVGKEIFNNCIKSYLQNKTVVLVTHQLQYLKEVDYMVILDNGAVVAQGPPNELQKTGINFAKFLDAPTHTAETTEAPALHSDSETAKENNAVPTQVREDKTSGALSKHIYISYIKSGANCCFAFVVFGLFILVQVCVSFVDYFLAYWVNLEQRSVNEVRQMCLLTYTGLIGVLIVLAFGRGAAFTNLCTTASVTLHDNMFRSIVRGSVRFFNTNPSGRILNRFSKDMGLIDESLPVCMIDALTISLVTLGIIVVISIVNPWLLLPAIIIAIVFYFLRKIYIATSRSVKRLDGVTRSPIMAHLNSSIQGITTIRAFGAQDILEKEFANHQDLNTTVACTFLSTSKAFGYWLDLCCVVYITLVTVSCLFIVEDNVGGNVGLIISQCLGLTGFLQWGFRQFTETENQMIAVERVLEYNYIEHEPPLENTETKPEESWPEHGEIKFVNFFLFYFEHEPPVLKNLNFTVKPLEKVGIVGRTGAGKSSLISALFRLTDTKGSILIDGVDINTLGLHDLRSKISIIPQEPVLFTGSMRRNLDPFLEFSDDDIWKVLGDVELKDTISNLISGLDSEVTERGTNLSVGQRQLVCLARAILRKNKILILDEATANVDSITDVLIQKTIRKKFSDCTVLTVAHRLDTVMDSDKILVMDAGEVVEFDHPFSLLQNQTGVLYRMVHHTGKTKAHILSDIAKKTYFKELTD